MSLDVCPVKAQISLHRCGCVPSEGSDQPAQMHRPVRVFTRQSLDSQVSKVSSSGISPSKKGYQLNIFLISAQKNILWVSTTYVVVEK